MARFERWQLSCKISDKAVENRILKAIPNELADQICVGLKGAETKAELLAKIKDTIVKKRSVFLCRADFHRIIQNWGKATDRYAARIRQAVRPCCLQTDSGTADYSPDLMSSIFILGLLDQYTKEKLFQIPAKEVPVTDETLLSIVNKGFLRMSGKSFAAPIKQSARNACKQGTLLTVVVLLRELVARKVNQRKQK